MLLVVDSELIVSIRNKFDGILSNYVVEVLPYSSHPSHNMEFCSGHLPGPTSADLQVAISEYTIAALYADVSLSQNR